MDPCPRTLPTYSSRSERSLLVLSQLLELAVVVLVDCALFSPMPAGVRSAPLHRRMDPSSEPVARSVPSELKVTERMKRVWLVSTCRAPRPRSSPFHSCSDVFASAAAI